MWIILTFHQTKKERQTDRQKIEREKGAKKKERANA